MYTVVRRYAPIGTSTRKSDLAERVEHSFLPVLTRVPGFLSYYLLFTEDDRLVSISVFETKEGADESIRLAAGWIREDMALDLSEGPEVSGGDVLLHAEARG